jgi:hypothetical protein
VQAALTGQRQQLLIRNTAPQKERQARREFDVADRVDRAGRETRGFVFHLVEEAWVHQQARNGVLHAHFKAVQRMSPGVEVQQLIHFPGFRGKRLPPAACREP